MTNPQRRRMGNMISIPDDLLAREKPEHLVPEIQRYVARTAGRMLEECLLDGTMDTSQAIYIAAKDRGYNHIKFVNEIEVILDVGLLGVEPPNIPRLEASKSPDKVDRQLPHQKQKAIEQ